MKKMILRVLLVVALCGLTLGVSLAKGPGMVCCAHTMACCGTSPTMACCK